MQSAKKRIVIISAIILILAVLAFLFVYHLPETWQWSGMKRWDGWKEGQPEFDITLDLQCWKRLFSHDLLKGTVIIDGEEYVYHAPANDPEHPEFALFVRKSLLGSPTEWLNDYVRAEFFSGRSNHLVIERFRLTPEAETDFAVESFVFDF
jgi:hypothetical protein